MSLLRYTNENTVVRFDAEVGSTAATTTTVVAGPHFNGGGERARPGAWRCPACDDGWVWMKEKIDAAESPLVSACLDGWARCPYPVVGGPVVEVRSWG